MNEKVKFFNNKSQQKPALAQYFDIFRGWFSSRAAVENCSFEKFFNGNNLAISFHWVLSSVVVKCCLKVHIILELMSLACHRKEKLFEMCWIFEILRNIYFDFFFNLQNWDSQHGRDSFLKINKYYVIFWKFENSTHFK